MPHRLSTRMIIRIRGGNDRKRFVGPLDQREFEKLQKEWKRLQVRQRLIFRRINKINKMKKSKMEKSNKKVKTRKLEKTRKLHRHF